MTILSRELLDHLCMLTALKLDDEEKQVFLPQLEQIITFVWQLDQAKLDEQERDERGEQSPLGTLVAEDDHFCESFLDNIAHQQVDQMPVLRTGLKK